MTGAGGRRDEHDDPGGRDDPVLPAPRPARTWWPWVGVAGLAVLGLWLLAPALSGGETAGAPASSPPATTVPDTTADAAEASASAPDAATAPTDPDQGGAVEPGEEAAGTTTSSAPESGDVESDTPAAAGQGSLDGVDRGDWESVARGFATEFARPGADWHDRVAELSGPALAEQLSFTDVRTVPDAELVDVEPLTLGDAVATARATYDDGLALWLRLDLQADPRSGPAASPDPGGTPGTDTPGGGAPLVWAVTGVEPAT